MRSVKCSVNPNSFATLKELIDWSQLTGADLTYRLSYRGTTMDDIQFELLVVDQPNVVFMSGSAKVKGGAGAGSN